MNKYYVKLVKIGKNSYTVDGVTQNVPVNQFARKNKVVNKRKFASKLKNSKLLVK
jgi:hypothetical protein